VAAGDAAPGEADAGAPGAPAALAGVTESTIDAALADEAAERSEGTA
jgi:hypothetical protein